jgi:hypothetical protein
VSLSFAYFPVLQIAGTTINRLVVLLLIHKRSDLRVWLNLRKCALSDETHRYTNSGVSKEIQSQDANS